ncbi:MAG: radical SAM protein [Bacteroidales bacterium]|nr:radical SAM protein [Bacteroidales bacterium]
MKKYLVNEIFLSLQGEGYWMGTPMVFLRFSGCNLRCPFCDTDHSSSTPYTLDALVAAVSAAASSVRRVCLTGGEPALQVDAALLDALHAAGFAVHIETNGTRPLPPGIDWVTLSPKSDFVEAPSPALEAADEIKVVFIPGKTDAERWLAFPARHHFLQPCYSSETDSSNVSETVAYILAHPSWRLSLQTHRLLGIR